MKINFSFFSYILLLLLIVVSGCDKDDDSSPSSLPPPTQTGAGTFGCMVNGQAFTHTYGMINCYYQHLSDGYYFGVSGDDFDKNPVSVALGTYSKTISEGQTIVLAEKVNGNAWGSCYFRISPTEGADSATNVEYTGELKITKLDYENHIVSGTFWFDVKHVVTGERVEVREGRFDAKFIE